MAERNKTRIEPHYYSEKLKRKLGILRSTTGTVVEAPSGYGKTTAVRDYLENSLPQSTPVFWFTAAEEESASAAFKRLCREIERIDPQVGGHLLELGLPIDINVGEACEELRSIECGYEAFLVIDNFQFLMDLFPFSFLASLLVHGGEQLHIILITQILRRNLQAFLGSHGVGHVTEAELRFSADDIHSYYKMAGVTISPEGAARVEHNTGGWVAAVYLNLCALREQGTLSDVSGILTMTEHLVWDVLEEAQQMFLLRLSPFETVTIPEACIRGPGQETDFDQDGGYLLSGLDCHGKGRFRRLARRFRRSEGVFVRSASAQLRIAFGGGYGKGDSLFGSGYGR